MSESDKAVIRDAFAEALASGTEAVIPVGGNVWCDWCDADWTARTESGGLLFQSKATCPDCVPRIEASARGYGEERFIRARCPEGMSFADWVRGMRGPGAAIKITNGRPGSAS